MKKFMLTIAIFCLAVSNLCWAGAADFELEEKPSLSQNNATSSVDGFTFRILTQDEYVDLLIDKMGMTESAAIAKAESIFQSTTYSGKASEQLAQYSKVVYPNSSCKNYGMGADYGFTARITTDVFPSFISIVDTWAAPYGSGPHSYIGNNKAATIRSSYEVQLVGNGQLEVAVQNGVSIEGGISAGDLVNIGFSASSSVGYTTYYRIPVSINTIIKQPWAT